MRNNKRLLIGISGGIGSGKSLASRYIESLGYKVLYADEIAKGLYKTNAGLKTQLLKTFGKAILDSNGNISGLAARKIILANRRNIKRVNKIVHPFVRKEIKKIIAGINDKIIFVEAAIMFESGYYREMDYTILIYAPKKLRIDRTSRRDKISRPEVNRLINLQMDEREKLKIADFIVRNDGSKAKLYKGLQGVLSVIQAGKGKL